MPEKIAFSKRDGLKMNGSSTRLGKKLLQYAIIALRCQCCQYGRGCFNVTHERQEALIKISFLPVYQIIDATNTCFPSDHIEN